MRTADILDAQVTNAKIASGIDAGKITTGTLGSGVTLPLGSTGVLFTGVTGPKLLWMDASGKIQVVTLDPSITFNSSTSTLSVGGLGGGSTGTVNTIPKLIGTGPLTYGDSMITDDGTIVAVTGAATALNGQPAPAPVSTGPGTAASNSLTVSGGPGGNTTDTAGTVGGVGAPVSITAGSGGTAPSGSVNGAGGAVTLNGGAAGAGAGAAGSVGNLLLQTTNGNVGIGTTSPAQQLQMNYGNLALNSISTPSDPTAALNTDSTASQLPAGAYKYAVTFTTILGETKIGTTSNTVTADATHTSATLTGIPVNTLGILVTGRNIYRTIAGGATFFKVGRLSDNVTTTFTDLNTQNANGWTVLDAALTTPTAPAAALRVDSNQSLMGAGAYTYKVSFASALGESPLSVASGSVTTDSTHASVTLSSIPIGGAGVVSRRIYRTTAGGSIYYLCRIIADNTTTSWIDFQPDGIMTPQSSPPITGSATGWLLNGTASVMHLDNGDPGLIVGSGHNQTILGTSNILIGKGTGSNLTSGPNNVLIGVNTAPSLSTGGGNVAIGVGALGGGSSLAQGVTGNNNFALGAASLNTITSGQNNISVGTNSSLGLTSGNDNVVLGTNAALTSGNMNRSIVLGTNAGRSVLNNQVAVSAVGSVLIGYQADLGGGIAALGGNPANTMTGVKSAGSANLGVGTYVYRVSFVCPDGETTVNSTNLSVTTDSSNKEITLSSIPVYVGPLGCTDRKIYRSTVGGTNDTIAFDHTMGDNTTTGFVDTVADTSLGAAQQGPVGTIGIGYDADPFFSFQAAIGSPGDPITTIFLGQGPVWNGTQTNVTLQGTGGSGTDKVGESITLAGGKGTGAGNGGALIFQTAPAATTGTGGNALVERMRIKGGGATGPAASATESLVRIGSTDIAGGSSSGTFFGLNAASGYAGDLQNWEVNGVSQSKTDASGNMTITGKATTVGSVNTGGVKVHRTAVASGAYSVLATDYYIALTGTTGGTFTLPAAATVGAGAVFIIKDAGRGAAASNLTLTHSGSDTLDGAGTIVMATNGESVMLISDGVSNYEIN